VSIALVGNIPPPTFEGTDSISILPLGKKLKRKELTLHHFKPISFQLLFYMTFSSTWQQKSQVCQGDSCHARGGDFQRWPALHLCASAPEFSSLRCPKCCGVCLASFGELLGQQVSMIFREITVFCPKAYEKATRKHQVGSKKMTILWVYKISSGD